MEQRDGRTRLTKEDRVITVESDSLMVALTTLATEVRDAATFHLAGTRTADGWRVRAAAVGAIPAQRLASPLESCGCLVNEQGAHRGDCPDFVTRQGIGGRYWTRREA